MNTELTNLLTLKDLEIVTKNFEIRDNLLKFDTMTLQLSNISRIYAGKLPFKIPRIIIGIFLISFVLVFVMLPIGILGVIFSVAYMFWIYQNYANGKLYLTFALNSGEHYSIFFKDELFLNQVRKTVEIAFNNKKNDAVINIAEQKIVNGNQHIIHGDNAVIDSVVQKDVVLNSHNSDRHDIDNHISNTIGDVSGSTIQVGNENHQKNVKLDDYNWQMLEFSLKAVASTIDSDSSLSFPIQTILVAVEKQDPQEFETIVKENKDSFLSGTFKNVASGALSKVILGILGMN